MLAYHPPASTIPILPITRQRFRRLKPLFPSLLEYRAAGLAEVGFLPTQAGGDRLHIWDFTGTEPVNVSTTVAFYAGF